MSDLLSEAQRELDAVERKLAELALLQNRRDQLKTFISLGRNLFAASETQPPTKPAVLHIAVPVQESLYAFRAASLSKKDRIAAAAAEIITKNGPKPTRDLLPLIEASGVLIGGGDKLQALSAVLSRDDRFKTDRAAGGWVLLQPHKEEPPQGVSAPAGA